MPSVVVPESGIIKLTDKVNDITVGLRFTTRIKLPSIEQQINDGTLQCRIATVTRLALRLYKSFGGKVGRTFDEMDSLTLKYNELYTGDVAIVLPKIAGTMSTDTTICILHDKPFPFNLLAVTRTLEIGGGLPNVHGM